MSDKRQMDFPRINFVALLAAALFLVSIFLFWWGIDTSGFLTDTFRWSLWSGPNTITVNGGQSAQLLVTYGPVIGGLVICAAALAVLGTIPRLSKLLIGSLLLAIISPVAYGIIVNTAVANGCSGTANCISGPFGTEKFSTGPFSLTVNWGFQTGFYLEIVGIVISAISIAFQRTYLPAKRPSAP